MKQILMILTLTVAAVASKAAIVTPTLPGGKNATVFTFEKKGTDLVIGNVYPASGSIGVITDPTLVDQTIAMLKRIGVKGVKAGTTTVYEIKDIYCWEDDDTSYCTSKKHKLKLDADTLTYFKKMLSDYKGTLADFEHYAEFAMANITCKLEKGTTTNGQCNFTY